MRFESDPDTRISLLFQKAQLASELNMPKTAVKTYDAIIERSESPRSTDALQAQLNKAEMFTKTGDFNRAKQEYDLLAKTATRNSPYYSQAKERILELQALRDYRAEIERAQLISERAAYTFIIAELYEELNCPKAAAEQHIEFIKTYPNHERAPESLYRVARIHLRGGRYQEAREAFERVAATYPASWFDTAALFQLGRIYLAQNEPIRALAALSKLLDERPTFVKRPEAAYLRAVCHERLGQMNQAAVYYRLFLDTGLYADVPVDLNDIAFATKNASLEELTAEIERKSARMERAPVEATVARALQMADNREYGEALQQLRQVSASFRQTEDSARAMELLPRFRALTEIDAHMRMALNSDNPAARARAQIQAAKLYEHLQEDQKALDLYHAAAESGDHARPWSNQAMLSIVSIYLGRMEDVQSALDAALRLIEQAPLSVETAEAYCFVGDIYRRRGLYAQAREAFESAQKAPQQPTFLPGGYEESPADHAAFSMARIQIERTADRRVGVQLLTQFLADRQRSPRIAAAQLLLSRLYEELGDAKMGRRAAQEALSAAESSAAQRLWLRREFPNAAHMDDKELTDWIKTRIERLK